MEFEQETEQVAKQYRDEGYVVLTHPDKHHLPGFAADYGADIVATRGNERVLVQVKSSRADVESDPTILRLAEIVNRQPGWRYDLVLVNEGDAFRRITRGAREPSTTEIDQALGEVEKLLQSGQNRAALVFAWAALEAAMRQVCTDAELYMPKTTASELLRTLYGNGVLTREEFDLLRESFRLRTEIVHGLISSNDSLEVVRGVVAVVRRLLTGQTTSQRIAG